MALDQNELQAIKEEVLQSVLQSLKTNSLTIDQLTPILAISDSDNIELSGGKRISIKQLKAIFESISNEGIEGIKDDIGGKSLERSAAKAGQTEEYTFNIRQKDGTNINITLPVASNESSGVMSAEDKKDLAAMLETEVLPFVAVIAGSEDINDLHAGKEGYYFSTEGYFYYCNAKKQVSPADEPYNVTGFAQIGGAIPKVANKSRLYQSGGKLYYFEGGELVGLCRIADSADIIYTPETCQLSLTEAAKRALFNDLWDKAWGTDGGYKPNEAPDKSKPYKAYDLWLTYEEALAVYDLGYITNQDLNSRYDSAKVRTTLPSRIRLGIANGQYIWQNSSVEVIDATLLVPGTHCFHNCKKLRRITKIYSINPNAAIDTVYKGCVALERIENFESVYRQNFSLADSPLLNVATFQRIVDKTAASGNQFTITVSPNIFDALLGDGEDWPVNGGTKEEWAKILTDAQAKNITFATA